MDIEVTSVDTHIEDSGNDSLEVSIFTTLKLAFPPLSGALNATLLLVQLFLLTDPFSLALFHTVLSLKLVLILGR
jgi:hypothetical protein